MIGTSERMGLYTRLSGRRLHAVTFILDYIQLLFDPPITIIAFSPVSVRSIEGVVTRLGDNQFRNSLCEQISKEVGAASICDAKSFDLTFLDGSGISISIAPVDCVGPEAIAVIGDGCSLVI